MRGLALLVTLILAAAFAVSAAAQEPADTTVQFTLARVVHATPDSHRRIGIRVVCQEVSGCKVALAIARTGTTPPQVLGRVFTQLIGGTTELVDAILNDSIFDAWPIQPDDSLAADADRINHVP